MPARSLVILFVISIAIPTLPIGSAHAHPASGIVVDDHGEVFFIDSGHALMKIDTTGKLETVRQIKDGHWLALDARGSFSHSQPKYFQRVTGDGDVPALIYAGGGAPLVVGDDGDFYYVSGPDDDTPGGLTLTRETPDGTRTKFSPALARAMHENDDGVLSLTVGPNSAIYVGCWTAVFKVNKDASVTTVASPVKVTDCDFDPADHKASNRGPLLRGIAVDSDGVIYAAATSCHRVIKITTDGQVSTVLKSERPWSPTGIAISGQDKYVLEYTNANGPATEGWRVRVRRIAGDGNVTTIATLPQD
jgi:hypothetical protein